MSEEKKPMSAGALSHEMRAMIEALFSLPEEMRERAVDALYQLVGPSRSDAREAAERREAAAFQTKVVLIGQLVDVMRTVVTNHHSHVETYPPPPETHGFQSE